MSEWRLALRDLVKQGYFDQYLCSLGQLLEPESVKVLSSSEKASASASVIAFGSVREPNIPNLLQDPEFLKHWRQLNRNVAVKITFPKIDPLATSGVKEEVDVYEAVNELLRRYWTPHIALFIGKAACTLDTIGMPPRAAQQFRTEVAAIYKANGKVPSGSDPIQLLFTEKGQGPSLGKRIKDGELNDEQLLSLVFQVVYTLYVFARIGIRHGDLHVGNILVDKLDEPIEVAYVPQPVEDLSSPIYQVPELYFAKLYDWDWGGIYDPSFDAPAVLNPKAMKDCDTLSSCGRNEKADLYTFLGTVWENIRKQGNQYPQTLALIQSAVNPFLLQFGTPTSPKNFGTSGGFQFRLCEGPLSVACSLNGGARVTPTNQSCRGPWLPPDCVLKTPLQVLNSPQFAKWRTRAPSTPLLYGMWTEASQYQHYQDAFAQPPDVMQGIEDQPADVMQGIEFNQPPPL